jgi:uncharacterized damage-inducible protein DinB
MSLARHVALMAHYNQWMNTRLYAAAAALGEDRIGEDRGAFFGSIVATLHHIYAADAHWLRRFADGVPELCSLDPVRRMTLPALVRGITHPDFARLRGEREALDHVIVAFAEEAGDTVYERVLRYTNSAGERHAKRFGLLVAHFFNHQTHHRGQVTTLFSQYGVDVGDTDLSMLVPDVD